ncbi:hypothetical protein [Pedobacter miscanthi]|uniref:hypothetical protein n=1 Tax=Pedobacter miscanthi TaxID=2259170 RepID=UPI002930CD3E|nr:hypothetical protein [Pedobacter miscanthi]
MTQDLAKEATNNSIPVSIASQMTAAFRKSQNAEKGTYTEAAWFPADQIISLTKNMTTLGGDGIRIYFGRYTDDIINQINKLGYGDKIPSTYAEMDTLLLVITKLVDGKPRTDYFVDKGYSHGHGHDHGNGHGNGHGYGGSEPTDPENRAQLCPQVCDDDSRLML